MKPKRTSPDRMTSTTSAVPPEHTRPPIFEPAPAALVSECFDLLLQAPRKLRLRPLAGLLKACSESMLVAMRAEAMKLGLVVESKSVFPKFSHDVLDSCFGFLDLVVCVLRKRYAAVCMSGQRSRLGNSAESLS